MRLVVLYKKLCFGFGLIVLVYLFFFLGFENSNYCYGNFVLAVVGDWGVNLVLVCCVDDLFSILIVCLWSCYWINFFVIEKN